jgi:hypothetical protein
MPFFESTPNERFKKQATAEKRLPMNQPKSSKLAGSNVPASFFVELIDLFSPS